MLRSLAIFIILVGSSIDHLMSLATMMRQKRGETEALRVKCSRVRFDSIFIEFALPKHEDRSERAKQEQKNPPTVDSLQSRHFDESYETALINRNYFNKPNG
jgi:hypothetical protein